MSRRTCQVFVGTKRCGEPAVDFVDISGVDISMDGDSEILTTRIPMCAPHWDEHQRYKDMPRFKQRKSDDKP